jgi:succinyl-diaminopimelate desuccinylase
MSADPIALARDLLRCPSVTPAEGGALALLDKVLSGAGFTVHRIVSSEPGAADVENLYARIGSDAPHLVLAGHTDVVPPGDEARWRHGPFSGDIIDGVLFGRGAVDMKGAIACMLAAVLDHLAANGDRPKGAISFLITGDEEGIAVNGTV